MPYLTPEEYLVLERQADIRSEYLDGEMFAMSGGNRWHSLVKVNLSGELSAQLKPRPCEVYSSDQRIHIPLTGLYTYPDVVVVCGEPRFEDDHVDTLLNPRVLIEVLSPTTESYDRGKKFEHYQSIDSLAEYLLVDQSRPRVEHYFRQDGNQWLLTVFEGLDSTVSLPSLQCELALAEVYDKVVFG
ncbi:MAG TPA: Uma2 family endonuclease [Thermoanaerobaculia bacterium]|nr:Uma2 family endonuclease [Thermoanaerobaculia bacterium]